MFSVLEKKILVTFFLISFVFIHWVGWNENSRLDLTRSIAEEGRLEINSFYNNTGDRAFYNGNYYSDKAPGISFMSVPVYAFIHFFTDDEHEQILEQQYSYNNPSKEISVFHDLNLGQRTFYSYVLLTAIFSSLFGSGLVVLIYKTSGFFTKDKKNRIITTFTFGFATLIFHYSTVFMGVITSAFFSFLSFYVILKIQHKELPKTYYFIAGILAGFAVVIEYYAFLVLIGLVYFLLKEKNILYFLIGSIIGISPLLVYNVIIFGTPFEFTLLHVDEEVFSPWNAPKINAQSFLMPVSIGLAVIPRLLFFPMKGLFFYHPVLIISALGTIYVLKKYRRMGKFILSLLLIFIIVNSFYIFFWGGTSFGLKHSVIILPFLSIGMVKSLEMHKSKLFFYVVSTLIAISVFHNILGLVTWNDPMQNLIQRLTNSEAKERIAMINNAAYSIYPISNPLYDYYLPLFLEKGPRSRLFESILNGKDIRDTNEPKFNEINFLYSSSKILSIKNQFVIYTIILVILTILWRDVLAPYKSQIIVFLTFILLVSVSLKTENYEGDWYPNHQFSKNASYIFFGNGENSKIAFYAEPYREKNLELFLNGEILDNYILNKKTELVTKEIKLEYGKNTLTFHSPACERPFYVEGVKDYRCISFFIDNITFTSPKYFIENNRTIVYDANWYDDNWIMNNSRIFVYSENSSSSKVLNISAESFRKEHNLTIFLNGILLDRIKIGATNKNYFSNEMELKEGENILVFSSGDCDILYNNISETDMRCLGIKINNVSFGYLKNFSTTINFSIHEKGFYKMNANLQNYTIFNITGLKLNDIDLKYYVKEKNTNTINLPLAILEKGYYKLYVNYSDVCSFNGKDCKSASMSRVSFDSSSIVNHIESDYQTENSSMDDFIWLSKSGKLKFIAGQKFTSRFIFDSNSFERERMIEMKINGISVGFFNISTERRKIITPIIFFDKGLNEIEFLSDGCSISEDKRCLSVNVMNPEIYDGLIKILDNESGWYAIENISQKPYRWLSNNAALNIFSEEENTTQKINVVTASYHRPRKMKIYINEYLSGEIEIGTYIKPISIVLKGLKKGLNKVEFLSDGCDKPIQIENSEDERCLGILIGQEV